VRYIILSLSLWLCILATAQTDRLAFRRFMTADGLSDNTVLCGLRDSYGFHWIGTADGLNCFDGRHNTAFHQFTSAASAYEANQITSLLEIDGKIWCGGPFGLYVYDCSQGIFSRFTATTRYGVMVSCTVQRMAQAADGRVWICTLGQGLFLYDPRSGEMMQDSRRAAFITDVAIGHDDRVCLTSLDGRLLVYSTSGRCLAEYTVPDFVSDKNTLCVGCVSDRVFVGCDQGLYQLLPDAKQLQPVPLPSEIGYVRTLLAEDTDHLLLGTDHGLFRHQLSSCTYARVDDPDNPVDGLSDDCVNALLRDPDGTLWVFTHHGGVCYQPALPPYLRLVPLPGRQQSHAVTRTFCSMPDGTLYVGTDAGLFKCHPSTGEVTSIPLGEETYEITALMADGSDLWVGTRHDGIIVCSLADGKSRRYVYSATRPYTVASNEISRIFRTRAGDIFVATSWGICHYDRHAGRFMGFSEINAMTPFLDMAEDSLGNLWAASSGRGLFCLKAGSTVFTNLSTETGLHSNAVSVVMTDSQGTLWVAYKDGVLQRRPSGDQRFEDFAPSATARPRTIHFIVEDTDARLWIGTDEGVYHINDTRTAISNVHRLSALLHDRQTRIAATIAQGTGYIGTEGIIAVFDPQRATAAEPPSPVYVVSLTFPYVADSHAELQRQGLDRPLYSTSHIQLPFADNSFTLHFSSPHFTGHAPVGYEYILRGYDRAWARSSENAEVTYTHLPPGDYEFLLRETGSTDPGTYARLELTIRPPWYRTIWAWLTYALTVCLLLALIILRTSRTVRRRYDRRLQAYRLEQEKLSFQSKINFFINLVHEIRTPLTLMSLPLEEMENEMSQEKGKEREHIAAIRRNMNYLLGITNQLLDFQKAENGHVNLQLTPTDVCRLLQDMAAQFTDAMSLRNIQFQLQLPPTPLCTALDRDKISKVLMNLLGNALKYARSEVILRLEETAEDALSIAVVDDGPGIPENEKSRIFDLYHQIAGDNVAATLGTGLGLAHAKMLARAHGGDICATDSPGGGTTFILTLPKKTPEMKDESAAEMRDDTPQPAAQPPSSKYTLLLVEDNEELLSATATGLKAQYRVLKARDGLQALDLLRHQDVDIVVSDVMMPRMDGNQLCQAIKENMDTSHIPVILLTAKTSVQAKLEGMKAGADVYLEKPFSMQQLQLQLQNIFRLRQQFHERLRGLDTSATTAAADTRYGLNEQDIRFMQRLQELVDHNMRDEQFSIDTLAEQMNMSRSSFYRKIKALTDLTPVDYMKTQRLQRAAKLLLQGQRITDVAAQVGFTSSSYFAKCFRQHFGVLPKDYTGQQPVTDPQEDTPQA